MRSSHKDSFEKSGFHSIHFKDGNLSLCMFSKHLGDSVLTVASVPYHDININSKY